MDLQERIRQYLNEADDKEVETNDDDIVIIKLKTTVEASDMLLRLAKALRDTKVKLDVVIDPEGKNEQTFTWDTKGNYKILDIGSKKMEASKAADMEIETEESEETPETMEEPEATPKNTEEGDVF